MRILRCGWYRIHKGALTGEIRAEIKPGQSIRYCLEDVMAMKAKKR
jgi:hypothetical protein